MIEINDIAADVEKSDSKSNFSSRVLEVLRQQKRTKSWLADEIGVTKQGMNYILSRSSKKLIKQIAVALEVNPYWLETGEGSYQPNMDVEEDIIYLPLINMQNLLNDCKSDSNPEKTVIANHNLSKKCFSTTLDNTSMEPLFRKGSILIFDPDKKPNSGDYVIFSLFNTKEVLFRQYFTEGKNIYLKAIDAMYKVIIASDLIIHGVLIESRNCFS